MPRDVVGLRARAPEASEARAVDAGATEVEMAEARAPGSVESEAVRTEARQASAPPLVQTISSEDSSLGKEAADAEAASTAERPVPTPAEGSSVLVRVRPEPRGWDSPRVLWRVLNQRVKMYCVSLIPDGDAKRHKVYTGSGNRCPKSERVILYSLHRGACSRGLQAGRERELALGLCELQCGLLEMLISYSEGACVLQSVARCLPRSLFP